MYLFSMYCFVRDFICSVKNEFAYTFWTFTTMELRLKFAIFSVSMLHNIFPVLSFEIFFRSWRFGIKPEKCIDYIFTEKTFY